MISELVDKTKEFIVPYVDKYQISVMSILAIIKIIAKIVSIVLLLAFHNDSIAFKNETLKKDEFLSKLTRSRNTFILSILISSTLFVVSSVKIYRGDVDMEYREKVALGVDLLQLVTSVATLAFTQYEIHSLSSEDGFKLLSKYYTVLLGVDIIELMFLGWKFYNMVQNNNENNISWISGKEL